MDGNTKTDGFRIPTSYESAVMGRRMLALTPLGTLATIFPDNDRGNLAQENRPASVAGMPHGLMEYISDCEDDDAGNPTLLAITIETSFKNIAAGSNVSLAVQWTPPHPPAKRIQSGGAHHHHHHQPPPRPLMDRLLSYFGFGGHHSCPYHHHPHGPHGPPGEEDDAPPHHHRRRRGNHDFAPYSAANLPRFSILGHIEYISGGDDLSKGEVGAKLASCFTKTHPDARYWLPGSRVHESHFARLVVEHVYWVGGFGDRAFIGWIPVGEWRNVTRQEWEDIRLPGEKKGWKEWAVKGQAAPVHNGDSDDL
ncbi:pyridoxamine 5'-phosphate oxidase-domain-containing protein [Bombardia bombarda]|uniref:Pyridoxamine 5'-phosphate oxidase-domain-containing protein n=1 Tax=Bombardia bombarda TaxID=252184 RepID=A0AA39WHZ5_9PEZI|nr:pyridoxamine 5'-phosphate oxidase-domain-containing protein [Bombardia bombarda]